MSDYQQTIQFFDMHAATWDGRQKNFDFERLDQIIDRACVTSDAKILDVACGTGILTQRLLEREFSNIRGIDVSPKMIEIYQQKFPTVISTAAAFEDYDFGNQAFDCVFIFNAFPHFNDPEAIFAKAGTILKDGGKLIIAHSMNRQALNEHHRNAGKAVEEDILISDQQFETLYRQHHFSDVTVEDADYFFSCGTLA